MRRPTSALALAKAFLSTALAATTVQAPASARQSPPNGTGADPVAAASAPAPPINPARGVRHLLRNGWDYIAYQQYERALGFFREAEARKAELNEPERVKLKQGIERAQRGLREASIGMTTEPSYARSGRDVRPGALALAAPPSNPKPGPGQTPSYEPEPIQLAGGGGGNANPNGETVRASVPGAGPVPASAPLMTPAPLPPTPDVESVPLPPLSTAAEPASAPAPAEVAAPAAEPTPVPVATVAAATPMPAAEPQPATPAEEPLPQLPPEPGLGLGQALPEPPTLPAPAPIPAADSPPPPLPADLPAPAAETLPIPAAEAAPQPPPVPVPVPEEESLPPLPVGTGGGPETPAAEPAGTVENPPAPTAAPTRAPGMATYPVPAPRRESFFPDPTPLPTSTLSPELRREVERIAQRQEEELKSRQAPGATPPGTDPLPDPSMAPGSPSQTKLEISRAPSPTEVRPIRAIPVPEEFVPLPKRDWNPNRKYWAAAAACHLPLYFQDASLERYGYSMEQRFGPLGRFMTIPLDDPRQSKQRNQIVQPFFSIGLFAAQIALLPYNMIMDPPWEAEYDLGYYRPGDRVPTDVYYLPLTGVGPPLRGKNYGAAPSASRW